MRTSLASLRRSHLLSPCALARTLHTTPTRTANPLPIPTRPGPPPGPPRASAEFEGERAARKKKQADLLRRGQQLKANPAKPASALQKRFWKEVHVVPVDDAFQIHLDTRPVRTSTKSVLRIPASKPALATGIALEWDALLNAAQAIKQTYLPLTSLTSRALDVAAADAAPPPVSGTGTATSVTPRQNIVSMLLNYLKTDTLLCWAPATSPHDSFSASATSGREETGSARGRARSLRELQIRTAAPIIAFLTTRVWPGVELVPTLSEDSILPTPQPQATEIVIRGWLAGLDAWELAGLERAVLAGKSLLVAVRLIVEWGERFADVRSTGVDDTKRFGIEEAAEACSLEVSWQTGMWGEVEDTHDVDKVDVRRQLGSAIMLVHGQS